MLVILQYLVWHSPGFRDINCFSGLNQNSFWRSLRPFLSNHWLLLWPKCLPFLHLFHSAQHIAFDLLWTHTGKLCFRASVLVFSAWNCIQRIPSHRQTSVQISSLKRCLSWPFYLKQHSFLPLPSLSSLQPTLSLFICNSVLLSNEYTYYLLTDYLPW